MSAIPMAPSRSASSPRTGRSRADSQEALVKQLGQLLADPKTRETQADASSQVVEQLGGALERTLAALEPYLMQLRIEMGAANA